MIRGDLGKSKALKEWENLDRSRSYVVKMLSWDLCYLKGSRNCFNLRETEQAIGSVRDFVQGREKKT